MVRWLRREVIARRWPRRRFFLDISKTCRTIGSRARSFIRSTRSCSCACWPYWQGPRPSPTSRVLARRSSLSCAAFGLSQAGRRRMIISATSSPRSTRRPSAGVSSPGFRHSSRRAPKSSPSTARPRAAPAPGRTPRSRSTWFRLSRPGSGWCWGKSRSPRSPTRSSPFRRCST